MAEAPRVEVGSEGLETFAGRVTEAYIAKLEWPGAYAIYNQMRRRDPTLRSMLNAIRFLARQAEWKAEAASDGAGDRAAKEFLDSCLVDMSHTVADLLDDVLTMMPFGWASLEICYKRREGTNGRFRSVADDGRIGWRKLAYRRQSSWDHWLFDDNGGFSGWVQRPAPDYQQVTLPVKKLIHFVAERDGNNPEGISLYESAYEPFHFVTNLQIISGIGWQRAFVGLPVFELEAGSHPQGNDLATIQNVGQGLVVDEKQYVSVPPGVKFKLESTQNSGADALLNTIKYYRALMLMICLADFISLGTTERGSWALGSDKSDLFLMAVNGYLDRIAETWTRFGVERLFEYNDFPGMTALPRITHSPVYKPNLPGLGSFISQVAQYIQIGDEDRIWIRQQAGMPELLPEQEPEPENEQFPPESEPELAEFAEGQFEGRAGIEDKIAREMAKVLSGQQDRVVAEVEQLGADIAGADAFWEAERAAVSKQLTGTWMRQLTALVEIVIAATEEALGAADWELINQAAASWAREFVGREIAGITETTRGMVRDQVAAWIEAGQELPELSKALAPTFGRTRADLIASTEVTRAFAEANDMTWKGMGLPGMAYKPPAHPRCRCWARPDRLPDGTWVVVWQTAADERVCAVPLDVPWGSAAGCGDLHGRIISQGDYLGERFREVKARLG